MQKPAISRWLMLVDLPACFMYEIMEEGWKLILFCGTLFFECLQKFYDLINLCYISVFTKFLKQVVTTDLKCFNFNSPISECEWLNVNIIFPQKKKHKITDNSKIKKTHQKHVSIHNQINSFLKRNLEFRIFASSAFPE